MQESKPTTGSLVLYKSGPAQVTAVSDKIDLLLPGGKHKRVRPKDIMLLHPGPLVDLADLGGVTGDLEEVCELLSGETVGLDELAELLYGEYTPATAWGVWELVSDGLYFEGSSESIRARDADSVAKDIAARESKLAARREQEAFLERLGKGRCEAGDRDRLREVEKLALGQSQHSRILASLGKKETPESAHHMLLRLGVWESCYNPHPARAGVSLADPVFPGGALAGEARHDLTHLASYAIDDLGSDDPDDAVSLEGGRVWVHVADVAAMVSPDSDMDVEARNRAANLYLPEKTVHMLPPELTTRLGLGLEEISPALSFGFLLSAEARIEDLKILPSLVKVSRLSYEEVESRMGESPFSELMALARRFRDFRSEAGAANLELPEVRVRVSSHGGISITSTKRLDSRQLVTELMLMTGAAVAEYALENGIMIPYAVQPAPDTSERPVDLAGMFAYRRKFKPSRQTTQEASHSGLGLAAYARTTSPLRRYSDLLTHQQLRAHLTGVNPLSLAELSDRIAASESGAIAVRRAERLSNLHWKLIYLARCSGWEGEGVVVERQERRTLLLIPELALETRVPGVQDLQLNQSCQLRLSSVDIPDQIARFKLA